MTDVLFYHLETQPLDRVLPQLLEKSLERGWRVVVQAGSPDRVEALDASLWTYSDESFLAHGKASEPDADKQPILITTDETRPNGATVRFLVDGASLPADMAGYERVIMMFDGTDPDAVDAARAQWSLAKSGGHVCTYWRQSPEGRWEKKA